MRPTVALRAPEFNTLLGQSPAAFGANISVLLEVLSKPTKASPDL